ncbi:MotE family protein [Campylobacter showae]|uniref:Putative periplasmic protein n=1 Tax=Campylobacter showae CSUNSWCD TaxID=1244083 RepID=M5ISX2_9BACT|nr:MotE family protein [Campylobacter showae]EKU12148.1 Putative periplasmic protein [Campylobacter showae CSUNSWCD]
MKKILILLTLNLCVWGANDVNAQSASQSGFKIPVDCVSIFETRKDELKRELAKIDEARQSLEAFRASSAALFEERNAKLAVKEAEINATLARAQEEKKQTEQLLKKNEEIVKELKAMTSDKVGEAYGKMKDQAAADVLSAMDRADAASIMYSLSPKKISAIMAKMEPTAASEITLLIKQGPPFIKAEKNVTQEISPTSPDGPAGNLLNL